MIDTQHFHALIAKRLEELGHRIHDIETELGSTKSKDLEDQAIDLEDDEVLEGLGLAAEREASLLRQALHRIETGSYGICMNCGEEISDARLNAVPHAALCRNCAGAGNGT